MAVFNTRGKQEFYTIFENNFSKFISGYKLIKYFCMKVKLIRNTENF